MTAPVAKAELAFFVSDRMSLAAPLAARRSLLAMPLAALRWLAELPRRQATMDDLKGLTDHELADIGLRRADIHRVFDPCFIAERRAAEQLI